MPAGNEAAPYHRLGVVDFDVLAALGADDPRRRAMPARLVKQLDGRSGQIGPIVAPLHQCRIDGEESATLLGKAILVELSRSIFGVWATLQDTVPYEQVQLVREHVARQTDAALEVLEASRAIEGLTHDHPDPALAHDARGSSYRTILLKQLGVSHAFTVARVKLLFATGGSRLGSLAMVGGVAWP
jgi:hypothetical protein